MKRGDPGYWAWRSKTGAPKKIPTPAKLWDIACKYFEEVDETPFVKNDFIRSGDMAGQLVGLPTMDVYTWEGLDDYLSSHNILAKLEDYKANTNGSYSEFSDVITRIGKVIYDRKFRGAAVGAFNANIIARDLGLADKTQTSLTIEQPLFPDTE